MVLIDTKGSAQLGIPGAFSSRDLCEVELSLNQKILEAISGPKSPWAMAYMECREVTKQLASKVTPL
jgi:hypothetical protein